MDIEVSKSDHDSSQLIALRVRPEDIAHYSANLFLERIAEKIAERFVAEFYQDIVKLIDQQALANMTVAEAGAKIHELLQKKLPDKILEIERCTEKVYQRGIFGGLRRIR